MSQTAIPPEALDRFRHAASQLTQKVRSPAPRLLALKDEIAVLRARGVSYRSISDLLTQNGISASDVTVMKFCHRFLKEKRRRKSARRQPIQTLQPSASTSLKILPQPSNAPAIISRGPRIAKIEQLPPGETL